MDLHFALFDWSMLLYSMPPAMCIALMQKSEQICSRSALLLKYPVCTCRGSGKFWGNLRKSVAKSILCDRTCTHFRCQWQKMLISGKSGGCICAGEALVSSQRSSLRHNWCTPTFCFFTQLFDKVSQQPFKIASNVFATKSNSHSSLNYGNSTQVSKLAQHKATHATSYNSHNSTKNPDMEMKVNYLVTMMMMGIVIITKILWTLWSVMGGW